MKSKTNTIINTGKKELLVAMVELATSYDLGIACWRKPNKSITTVQIGDVQSFKPSELENMKNAFVFCPYDENQEGKALVSKLTVHIDNEQVSIDSISESTLVDELEKCVSKKTSTTNFYFGENSNLNDPSRGEFDNYVNSGIEAIRSAKFEKVVPARFKNLQLPAGFDPIDTFDQLCSRYSNAFISLLSLPEVGTWIGATPEALISISEDNMFSTVALAGTQRYNEETPISEVAWTQKEIEEQALVSRYIINCFKKIRLREFTEIGPKTVVAGNLMHLKTSYTVDMEATKFPLLGSVMLELLHPTSAVCGMPKEPASEFIKQYEGDRRGFYSGYLGPVNVQNETAIFVNLRCMQLHDKSATLYAGAGLTEDSIPEKEWLETEMKMNTLLSVIKP